MYVGASARESVCGFLAAVMGLIEWTPEITAFGISTQVNYHFSGMVEFLDECPVPDVSAHTADFNVNRFLFHLEHLKVFYSWFYPFIHVHLGHRFSCCFSLFRCRPCQSTSYQSGFGFSFTDWGPR